VLQRNTTIRTNSRAESVEIVVPRGTAAQCRLPSSGWQASSTTTAHASRST
jgi:hypothetical protein